MTTRQATFISFASPKGGVGKSTTCACIAGALCARGYKVHIVDFDQTQTIWDWFSDNPGAKTITNLTVERAPPDEQLGLFMQRLWHHDADYVLIDLAGALTDITIKIAMYAHLTITPTKLNVPDVVQADKLGGQIEEMAKRLKKPYAHRVLINEVPSLLANVDKHLMKTLDASALSLFKTMIRYRTPIKETFNTGLPPHFANRSRSNVVSAMNELDVLVDEMLAAIPHEQKAAA